MKWVLVAVAVAAGCQDATPPKAASAGSGTTVVSLPKADVTDAYRADITNLCDAMRLSGAEDKPQDERWVAIAMWLGPHITTDGGREFLVAIQPLKGEAKALALETEAKRVGLTTCALAGAWRGQP